MKIKYQYPESDATQKIESYVDRVNADHFRGISTTEQHQLAVMIWEMSKRIDKLENQLAEQTNED